MKFSHKQKLARLAQSEGGKRPSLRSIKQRLKDAELVAEVGGEGELDVRYVRVKIKSRAALTRKEARQHRRNWLPKRKKGLKNWSRRKNFVKDKADE